MCSSVCQLAYNGTVTTSTTYAEWRVLLHFRTVSEKDASWRYQGLWCQSIALKVSRDEVVNGVADRYITSSCLLKATTFSPTNRATYIAIKVPKRELNVSWCLMAPIILTTSQHQSSRLCTLGLGHNVSGTHTDWCGCNATSIGTGHHIEEVNWWAAMAWLLPLTASFGWGGGCTVAGTQSILNQGRNCIN